jgi:threonyl-tRNA synthetase
MNAKIRDAQLMKIPYMLVVGGKELEAGTVSLRVRDGSQENNIQLSDFIARIKERIDTRASEL